MTIEFRPATPEDRRRYYSEEWSLEDIPYFILDTIDQREFGFDHDGSGPNDRYNVYGSPAGLEDFLRRRAPFAAYSSISLYMSPGKRKGWQKAELIFDIDSKDLPFKNCCGDGEVCTTCLGRAKDLVMKLDTLLTKEFCIQNINYVYSGRGYHIRILDEDIMPEGDPLRASILDYVRGNVIVKDEGEKRRQTLQSGGYTAIFRSRLADLLRYADLKDLRGLGISAMKADEISERREEIVEELERGRDDILKKITKTAHETFKERAGMEMSNFLDAKVTVDVKRILRLPSSLHSKVSMKCMWVEDIEGFDPLKDAVPEFVADR